VLPINPTHRRPQLFDARHPNYGGYMGIRVPPALIGEMKKADLIVSLGERLTDSVSQSYTFPARRSRNCRWCMSGRTRTRSAASGASIWAFPADPHEVIKGLLALGAPKDAAKRAAGWTGLHKHPLTLLEKTWEPTTDGINFAAIVCEVDKHLADDAVVTSDAGNFGSFIHRYIGFKPGQEFLSSIVGAMGSGMPMAVAGDSAPAGQAGRRVHGRRRRADDGQRDRHGDAVRRLPDPDHLRQFHVRHDRDAQLRALSGTQVHGRR
jgi:acetolactate synthase-1/2/3 large subunit